MVEKPNVILIHGMWSTGDSMSELAAQFQQWGYRTETPDLPFHRAKSEMNEETLTALKNVGIQDYVDAIQALIDKQDNRVLLVGYSMGGLIAQILAARNPVAGLVLLAPAAPAGINSWRWSVLRTFGKNIFKFPLWNSATEIGLANIRYGIANSLDELAQRDLLETITFESGRATWQIANWYFYRSAPTIVEASELNCPILQIAGVRDRITPPSVQKRLAEKYPQARLHLIEEACHWLISGKHLPKVSHTMPTWLAQQQEAQFNG